MFTTMERIHFPSYDYVQMNPYMQAEMSHNIAKGLDIAYFIFPTIMNGIGVTIEHS